MGINGESRLRPPQCLEALEAGHSQYGLPGGGHLLPPQLRQSSREAPECLRWVLSHPRPLPQLGRDSGNQVNVEQVSNRLSKSDSQSSLVFQGHWRGYWNTWHQYIFYVKRNLTIQSVNTIDSNSVKLSQSINFFRNIKII